MIYIKLFQIKRQSEDVLLDIADEECAAKLYGSLWLFILSYGTL